MAIVTMHAIIVEKMNTVIFLSDDLFMKFGFVDHFMITIRPWHMHANHIMPMSDSMQFNFKQYVDVQSRCTIKIPSIINGNVLKIIIVNCELTRHIGHCHWHCDHHRVRRVILPRIHP